VKKIVISCLGGIAGMVLLSLLAAPAANANNSGCYAHRNQVKTGHVGSELYSARIDSNPHSRYRSGSMPFWNTQMTGIRKALFC